MMNRVFFLFCITILFFSCTIEKRRYFKGYHIENGRMGKWENGEVSKREREKVGKSESAQAPHCAAHETMNPQLGDIEIAGDLQMLDETSMAHDAALKGEIDTDGGNIVAENIINSDDGLTDVDQLKVEEKLIQPELKHNVKSSQGGDVVDVGRVIFGMLSIVSFALALLFFGSAIFAIDSLVMTVLLLIGGGFALAGLVFLVIYALIKRKQSSNGHIVGHVNEEVPKEKKPISFWGVFIPFLIFAGLTVFFAIQLGMETLELAALIGYFGLIMIAFPLALLFLILTVVALVRRHRYVKMKNGTPPKDYKE